MMKQCYNSPQKLIEKTSDYVILLEIFLKKSSNNYLIKQSNKHYTQTLNRFLTKKSDSPKFRSTPTTYSTHHSQITNEFQQFKEHSSCGD